MLRCAAGSGTFRRKVEGLQRDPTPGLFFWANVLRAFWVRLLTDCDGAYRLICGLMRLSAAALRGAQAAGLPISLRRSLGRLGNQGYKNLESPHCWYPF